MTGLGAGGDDYITKPFKRGGFSFSKINALLRRANSFQAADTEIAVEWHQSSFAARTGFQKWGAVGFDCRGIQATVLVYEKPKHGADKRTNFR